MSNCVMHYIIPAPDGTTTSTLCGLKLTVCRSDTDAACDTGDYITCPLCEAARVVDNIEVIEKEETKQ